MSTDVILPDPWAYASLLDGERRLSDPETLSEESSAIREASIGLSPILRGVVPGWTESEIAVPLPDGWHAFNPSVISAGDGFLMSVRCANYTMPGSVLAPGHAGYLTRNTLVPLDASGRQAGPARQLADLTTPEHELDAMYQGPEDLRLFAWQGRLMGLGTCARRLGTRRERVLCLGLFDIDLDAGAICRPRWLAEGQSGPVEKNWMPAVGPEGVKVVYSCGPTVSFDLDTTDGQLSMAATHRAPIAAWRFRGGSQLLPFGDGWIAFVHEGIDFGLNDRTYLQRIVRFGADFAITHFSPPLRMRGEKIEFVSGLAWCGDRLLITYSVGDRMAIAASAPAEALSALLLPVEDIAPAGVRPGESAQAFALLAKVGDRTSMFDQACGMLERGWHEGAVTAFRFCARFVGDDLLASRAAFRAAMILGSDLGRWNEAVDACLEGMARTPDLVDLYWAAGFCSYWGGRYAHAASWARMAMSINDRALAGEITAPGGIEYPEARLAGPADILAHAERKLAAVVSGPAG